MMTVAERLKVLREKKGYTMDYVAKMLGVAQQTYFKYEHNIIVNIPIDKVELLARLFGVTEGYIMGWDKLPENNQEVELVDLFNQLDPDDQAEVIDIMKLKLSRKKDVLHVEKLSV